MLVCDKERTPIGEVCEVKSLCWKKMVELSCRHVIGRLDSGDSKLANTWPNEAADGCTCFLSSRVAPGLIHASVCMCVCVRRRAA